MNITSLHAAEAAASPCYSTSSSFPFFLHVLVHLLLLLLQQTDFLLVVLRDMLRVYPDLRVILMSATINTSLFSSYYGHCPIIEVEGKTYPVQGERLPPSSLIPAS